jgi:tetratricopeptide (TPR) repeat protein
MVDHRVAQTERTCVVTTMPHLRERSFGGRGARLGRATTLGAILIAGALTLSACDGPSATQSAGQNVTAGIAAQKAGNYGQATTDYEKALKVEPKNVFALYDLGDVEQYQHQFTAAAQHYQEALAVNPHYEYALYNLAIIDAKSDPAASKALYLEVIQLYPKDAVAHFNLGKVELRLGEKHAGDAQINLAIKLEPGLKSQAPPNS